jgi:hypothetical protein
MSPDEFKSKLALLTEGVLTPAERERLYDLVMDIENAADLSALMQLCEASSLPAPV